MKVPKGLIENPNSWFDGFLWGIISGVLGATLGIILARLSGAI